MPLLRASTRIAAFVSLAAASALHAQTIDDGIMLNKHNIFAGFVYTTSSWDHYWEGSLYRSNGNLGTVTTQTKNIYADYGVTNHLNVIANIPYVETDASQGVLAGQSAWQDMTLGAKYSFYDKPVTEFGSLRLIGVLHGSFPMTDYNPDFQPLSVGDHSKRLSTRFTANFQSKPGWFVNVTGAHTWRSHVFLDRSYYYTNNQLYLTNEVDMPRVFDYSTSAGYFKHGVMANFSWTQQRTQGGGDIRPQDAPFISNMFNFSKIGALLMVPIPAKAARNFTLQFAWSHTYDGRNVGEATAYTTGLLYTMNFHRKSPRP
jgi:hypothetical protein